jgi:2-desacetyl-2-hydroxyethyl bacteriochlorophyllide A dehydrogenase
MKAAVFNSPWNLSVVEKEVPAPGNDDILIKTEFCGICGTDFHIYEGKAPAAKNVILGHEYAGEVVEMGKAVTGFKPGEKIAVNPNIHCGYCRQCRKGKIHLCENLKALGVTIDGGFAEYSRVPAMQAHKFPNNFPADIAAFAEPVSCCLHGIEQADVKINDTVLIIGAGAIGLIMLQLARLKGANKIIMAEKELEKTGAAMELGADFVLNPADEKYIEALKDYTSGGPDVVIECAGNQAAADMAVNSAAKGGAVVIFGLSSAEAKLTAGLQSLFHRELNIKSSLLNPFTFQPALDLLTSGKVKTDLIKVKKIGLENEALRSLLNGNKDKSIQKYMIVIN